MRLGPRTLLALLVLVATLVAAGAAQAKPLHVTGEWKTTNHCTSGWCDGQDFPFTFPMTTQTGGHFSGGAQGWVVAGTVSGRTLAFTEVLGGYVATFEATLDGAGTSYRGTWTDTNGVGGTTRGTIRPTRSISGTVKLVDCGDESCPKPQPVAGATVTATGPKGGGTATTDAKGAYEIDVPPGTYTVTPTLGETVFEPESRTAKVGDGDAEDVDFVGCGAPEDEAPARRPSAARSTKGVDKTCTRVYTLVLKAWIPYTSIVDPAVGSDEPGGTGYPVTAKAFVRPIFTDHYPACLKAGAVQAFEESRANVQWRSRFLGHGHADLAGASLGTVTVPISYNGAKQTFAIRNVSVQPGTMQRTYDWTLEDRPATSCTVTRAVTPTVSAEKVGDRFDIQVSWPLPFQPYEDIGTVNDFGDVAPNPLSAAEKLTLDKQIERIPGFKQLPKAAQTRTKAWVRSFAEHAGLKLAIKVLDQAARHSKNFTDFFADRTPPPIKWGKKANEVLQSLAYGSADMHVTGYFSRTRFGSGLTITSDSDGLPSFGLEVRRSASDYSPLPWRDFGSGELKVVNPTPTTWAPGVVSDAFQYAGPEAGLQGGAAAKLKVTEQLGILTNVLPSLLRPYMGPKLIGGSQPQTLSWAFIGGKS